MKKIIFLMLLVIGFSINSKAQTLMPLAAGDTIITSASTDTVFKYLPVTAGYSSMAIQVVATKISGTVAGKAYLYGTIDGTNYIISDSSSAFADQTTNTVSFTKTPAPFAKYMVQVHQPTSAASTQSVKIRMWYVLKKYDR